MSNTVKHAVDTLNFAHGLLTKMIDTIPADKATYQLHPTSNHVLWTLGHLATTYNWLVGAVDPSKAAKLPESYNALFGMGSVPNPEASKYPSAAELRKAYDSTFQALVAATSSLNDATAWSAPACDTGGFCSSKIDAAYKAAWHDGWHIGQVSDLRRALKLPGIF